MNAIRFLRDIEYEDEVLFSATIWVDETRPRYISISLDEAERPGELYFEAEDQVYGKYTRSLACAFAGSTLILTSTLEVGNTFHWTAAREIRIEMKSIDLDDAREVLRKIFSTL
jgi:hypothetical protein